jgi:uncharacterized protein (DUF305 family)
MTHGGHEQAAMNHGSKRKHYGMLALNLAISLAIMYLVMFAMIWSWGEFVQNINFFYMALMMWAPMGSLMLLTMPMMYRDKRLNTVIHAALLMVLVLSTIGIRQQGLVGDRQFLRSMIPHHSGAILMCEEASITDPRIRQLCEEIISSQKAEIDQMKSLLKE